MEVRLWYCSSSSRPASKLRLLWLVAKPFDCVAAYYDLISMR